MSNTATTSNLRGNTRKIMISLGVVAAAAAVAGMGTFGTFTSTTSGSEAVNSGTVAIALGSTGTPANRLNVAAANIVAGDTIQRAVTLSNTGTSALSGVTLTTAATPSSLLDTDTTQGLQMLIQSCPTAWAEAGTSPAFTYTCAGGATAVVATKPVIALNTVVTTTKALPAGGVDNLMVTLTLPSSAPNTLQGQSSTIGFTFTGTQRTATNQ